MPDEGVLPMHSSVNVGEDGDSAVFFGLSGTGKTTLSADPERSLIGDDEHGWSDDGRLQLRGRLLRQDDPPLADLRARHLPTTRRFGTILENVDLDPVTRELDLDSERFTENTRGAFPLHFIGNADPTGMAGHPSTIVFLTADAFGVLPPIARLTHDQAMYHFISGYTAKLAGTEVWRQGADGDVLDVLRGAVHAAPPRRVRRDAGRADGRSRRAGLAGQHRLDRRPVRHRRADEHHHTRPMVRAALDGRLDGVADAHRPELRLRGAGQLPRRAGRGPRAARDLGRHGRLRPPGEAAGRDVRRELQAFADGVGEEIRAAGPVTDPATLAEAVDPDHDAG